MMKEVTLALIVAVFAAHPVLASNRTRNSLLETRDDYYRRHAAEEYNYEKTHPNSLSTYQGTAGDPAPANNPYSYRQTKTNNYQGSNTNGLGTKRYGNKLGSNR
ncbi:MAG: hypothetical protein EOM37_07325 [Proteobacteria bacterium]|nr:hypothetical protein [Pseudomonadota bacterium]